jgi:hypothetical protein
MPRPQPVAPQLPTVAPFRDELLGKVTIGTPDERRKYAELLPLRMLVAYGEGAGKDPEFAVKFLKETLDYIEQNNVVEAAGMLEPSLKLNNALLSYDERIPRLWLKLKTHGMSDERKAEFLAGLLAPGVDNWAWRNVDELYPELGAAGHKALLRMLGATSTDMTHKDDRLRAAQIARLLSAKELETPDAEALLQNKSVFVKCVMFKYLALKRDKRALGLLHEIWEAVPVGHPSGARKLANSFNLAPLDNLAPELVWMLRRLDEDERTIDASMGNAGEVAQEVSELRKSVFFSAINAGARGQSRELRQYLQEYVKRPLELKHGMDSEDLMVFYEEYSARGLAKELLNDWWKGPR